MHQLAAACLLLLLATQAASQTVDPPLARLLRNSWLFYEGQQSGELPTWNQLLYAKPGGWKKAAHLEDGKDIGANLAGGYYDAGDYLKCAHPLAWGTANLALSLLEFRDAVTASGTWDIGLRNIKYGLDWLMKAHVRASGVPGDNVFVGQVRCGHRIVQTLKMPCRLH